MTVFTAFYDLEHGPVSYDFVTWLVRALKEARGRKLHVVVVPKEDGLGGFSRHWGKHDEHAARWRLWHIVVASCPLAGATVTLAPSREEAEIRLRPAFGEVGECWWPQGKAHLMGPLVNASRKGESIPLLQPTEAARRYVDAWLGAEARPLVTLTLRQQDTDPDRNCNRAAWAQLANWLMGRGCRVEWLDDTHVALGHGRGYGELDPDLRLALYERAAMNLIGNNGPQELLKFSRAPYRIFGLALSQGWIDHFRRYFHMEVGDQLPWAAQGQRLVYRPDSFEVLREEFERWAGATS